MVSNCNPDRKWYCATLDVETPIEFIAEAYAHSKYYHTVVMAPPLLKLWKTSSLWYSTSLILDKLVLSLVVFVTCSTHCSEERNIYKIPRRVHVTKDFIIFNYYNIFKIVILKYFDDPNPKKYLNLIIFKT